MYNLEGYWVVELVVREQVGSLFLGSPSSEEAVQSKCLAASE